MTRHHESPHTSLPVRSRGSTGDDVSDNVDSQAHGGAQSIFRQSSQHFNGASQYSMYPFGSEPIVQANHEFPPAMSPEMEFPMSTQYYYEGAGEEELLSAYMTSEEAKSGDIFDVYPSMVDETFYASITDWSAMVTAPPHHVSFIPGQDNAHMLNPTFSANAHHSTFSPTGHAFLSSEAGFQTNPASVQSPQPPRKPHRCEERRPYEMYGHLELKEVHNRMPEPFRDAPNQPFMLRLHQYFDDPELTIPVIRFVPRVDKDISKATFPIESDGKVLEVKPTEILSPPLVPAISNANFAGYVKHFRWSVRRWLDCAEMHQDIEWHLTFFREEYGKPWPRAVFADVCQFYHKVEWGSCAALKSGLQSTVFAYMLGHSFYVPHEDIQDVVDRTGLEQFYDGEFMFVSPIHVDRFIKAMLFPFFRTCVGKTLRGFQELCAASRQTKYSRDRILATSIVLLIVAASQQSKAIEKAVAMQLRGEDANPRAVHRQIDEIERWIINLVLQVWDYKFNGTVRWGDDEPSDRSSAYRAKLFGLYEKFELSYQEHRGSLQDLPTELPEEINERTFGATNIDRVLKKFYKCVFEPQTQDWATYNP
ncbi:hypothetical protein OHC33_006179 [Knufia fluminis]|uniref:Uncharacterized protein n=1 Tax=Knufia fluminis TaxID=191047 RepID=A0AAN8EK21_9EURO|nr:hypothetical protein OHC33_006179 [Knufia fluminis]